MNTLSVPETEVFDHKGERVLVGSRVVIDFPEKDLQPERGTVKQITDPDIDVNDEGRQAGINPSVYVQWDDDTAGELDSLSTCYAGDPLGELPEFTCDDLEVVEGDES